MPDLHNIRLPAGWYPDPNGADHRRWWDGKVWTQHTAPFLRPVNVWDGVETAADETTDASAADERPAPPRRIRTAAKLGRTLAALAHKLPFGLPEIDPRSTGTVPGPPPSPPGS